MCFIWCLDFFHFSWVEGGCVVCIFGWDFNATYWACRLHATAARRRKGLYRRPPSQIDSSDERGIQSSSVFRARGSILGSRRSGRLSRWTVGFHKLKDVKVRFKQEVPGRVDGYITCYKCNSERKVVRQDRRTWAVYNFFKHLHKESTSERDRSFEPAAAKKGEI